MRYESKRAIESMFWNLFILTLSLFSLLGMFFFYRMFSGYIVVKRSWLEESQEFKFKENKYKCFKTIQNAEAVSSLEIYGIKFDYFLIDEKPYVCKVIENNGTRRAILNSKEI